MKRSAALVLVLVLALGLFSAAAAQTMWVKTPNGKTVNVRADQFGTVIGRLPYRATVDVIDEEDIWYIVNFNGTQGYIKEAFLSETDPGPFKGGSGSGSSSEPVFKDSALGSQTVDGLNKQYSTMNYVTPYTVRILPDTKTGTARLRWAPSKNSTLLTLLPANYELTVLASNKNWLLVQDPASGSIGYIAVKFTYQ